MTDNQPNNEDNSDLNKDSNNETHEELNKQHEDNNQIQNNQKDNQTDQQDASSLEKSSKISKTKKKRANDNDTNKKRKKIKKWGKNSVVDKNKLTMFDLISYNPPVANDNESQQNNETTSNEHTQQENDQVVELSNEKQNQKKVEESEDDEDESIGPRVKINENGEIVLDEASLIVKRKKPKDQNIKTVYEDDKTLSTRTNYSSFKKPGKTNEKKLRWTDDETVKFYTALTIIGTDFTLMSDLFFRDQRSRVDLKNKFKQEEKCHKKLIDNALKKSDLTSIQHLECIDFDVFSSDDSDTENTKTTTSAKDDLTSTAAS